MTTPIYLPRDFIETFEGLVFAVVDPVPEEGRVLSCLRYVPADEGWRKVDSALAQTYLAKYAPDYLFASRRLEAHLHGVPLGAIRHHHQPRERARTLLAAPPRDAMEDKAVRLLRLFTAGGLAPDQIGITGSLLLGAHTSASDLDVVIYGREAFDAARSIIRNGIERGVLAALDLDTWRETYARRGCELDFDAYLWHERRKFNKGVIDGTKFDITLLGEDPPPTTGPVKKRGMVVIQAQVIETRHAFDHPAFYRLDHPEITEARSFTQTYAGQAETGETVEIAGCVEDMAGGRRGIVVGSSREAPGEYIRVIRPAVPPVFRAAIFDMDGLVLDSEITYVQAWRRAARALGRALDDAFFHSLFGRHADDVEQALREAMGESFDRERFHALAARYWREHLATHGMGRMPGLETLLALLRRRGIPYALATNSDAPFVRECLELAGLALEFPVVVTRDQVARGKPAPDVYLEAARRLGVPAGLCLGLEDSPTGLQAADQAGTITLVVQKHAAVRCELAGRARFAFASLEEVAAWLDTRVDQDARQAKK